MVSISAGRFGLGFVRAMARVQSVRVSECVCMWMYVGELLLRGALGWLCFLGPTGKVRISASAVQSILVWFGFVLSRFPFSHPKLWVAR